MRIQHNIMAMSSYRNFMTNNSALGKNLEKLSSGYRINRAGDDAAGLAISEKMRAQITGLDAAQKNVKDGISLVKTAEGAMQEIQDMMSRMKYLATQSANGTYQNEVDRENLQKEVDALKTEINRIAESSNFNGQKLLNGELSANGSTTVTTSNAFKDIKGALASNVKDVDAVKASTTLTAASFDTTAAAASWASGDTISLKFSMSDGKEYEMNLTVGFDKDGKVTFTNDDGNVIHTYNAAAGTAASGAGSYNRSADVLAAAIEKGLKATDLGDEYTITSAAAVDTNVAGGKDINLEHMAGGSAGAIVTEMNLTVTKANGDSLLMKTSNIEMGHGLEPVKGEDKTKVLQLASNVKIYDGGKDNGGSVELEDAIMEIGGEKFVFLETDSTTSGALGQDSEKLNSVIKDLNKQGIHFVKVDATSVGAAHITELVNKISNETGLDVQQGTYSTTSGKTFEEDSTGTDIKIASSSTTTVNGGNGLTLQIGDTADVHNQLNVQVSDMHVEALGISDLDISTQEKAQKAIEKITDSINLVSQTRGDLGAIQNRLEHTQNNLSVMEENIQDAEATIRDTDMADEMTAYTKNNILMQAAQAMLAQANQVPQGVLQLLQ